MHIDGEVKRSAFAGIDIPSDDLLTSCMHCGLCLPTCPTYSLTGNERSSPRGRIRLIKAVAEGTLGISDRFIEEMYFCLDCQACETACPAGVKYGSLVEAARAQIRNRGKESVPEKILKSLFFENVLSKKWLLKYFARLLRLYQRSGVERMVRDLKILSSLAPRLAAAQELSPRIDASFFDDKHPEVVSPPGLVRYRVGFLSGCFMNVSFSNVNEDTLHVLLHNDCEVVIPKQQECCGSLQAHNGDFESARKLARHNIDVFSRYNLDYIVINSAGCSALMKEYGHYLHDDPLYAQKADAFSAKVKDLAEFLVLIGFKKPVRQFAKRVSYHDACHLVHTQKIGIQPRMILQAIPGLEYIELREASWCCGSAGIYNVVHYADSMKLLKRKMDNIALTHAEYIVASNPGCLGQIEYGIRREGIATKVVHLATLLREAYHADSLLP